MACVIQKNELTASKRRCVLYAQSSDGMSIAGREIDLTGYVYLTQDSTDLVLGVGTIVNMRRALIVADDTFTAATTDICTAAAHGLETGDGPVRLTTTDTLPAGLSLATDYWIIKLDADTFSFAESLALAYAGTAVDITDTGTGTHTLSDVATTQRGIDGWFCYTLTQAETNYATSEMTAKILGHATYVGHASIEINSVESDIGGAILEGSTTRDDAWRILLRGEIAKFSKSGNDYVIRDLADSKDSHHGTVTASGRTVAVIDDAT